MPRHRLVVLAPILVTVSLSVAATTVAQEEPAPLVFPGLLEKEQREAGNPLATYAAMVERDAAYRIHPVFGKIYPEVRGNFEQFLGDPLAGLHAMRLIAPKGGGKLTDGQLPDGVVARNAVAEIGRAAAETRLVIFGEEHHLPQT